MATSKTLHTFEARVWEKAEHWYFYAKVDAKDERDAYVQFRKEWPKREYSVSEVRQVWREAA